MYEAAAALERSLASRDAESAKTSQSSQLGEKHTDSFPAPHAGEGLPAGAARLGCAALQEVLLELQGAVVDVEGWLRASVMTMACEMRCIILLNRNFQ